jgi:hypothetical protein
MKFTPATERNEIADRFCTKDVYITRSNFNSLVFKSGQFTSKHEAQQLIGQIKIDYYRLNEVLSDKDLSYIATFIKLLVPENLEHYVQREPKTDNYEWVYERGNPAYHCNSACDRLHSDYFNYPIPEEILKRNDIEQNQKYRDWFKSEGVRLLQESKEELFTSLEKMIFSLAIKTNPLSVRASNTGVVIFEDMNLESLKAKIEKLLLDATHFVQQSDEVKAEIKRYGYGTSKESVRKMSTTLTKWHDEFKQPLTNLLKQYFLVKLNPNLSFKGNLLDTLGYKPCGCCHNHDQ